MFVSYLLVDVELAEDLGRIKQVGVLEDPTIKVSNRVCAYGWGKDDALLSVPGDQRQVEDEGQPVSVDEEQEGQECVNGGFGDDVGVKAVAEVDRVDVITRAPQVSPKALI